MITKELLAQYEPTIGIECHVQLKTKTKLFSGADNDAREAAPNTTVSPICFGMPGTLPVLNREAITMAIRAGIALQAEVAPVSSFDRKHYFYPDLPKGYQITQLERPTIGKGKVEVPFGDKSFTVRITRAHIEEDAGKLTHPDGADYSLVDLNRAGTPLIEIVSEADMHSAAQAKAYVQELYLLMRYADVTEGNLYYGNMRFDVNISVAKKGASKWGTRVEIKNLNSFRSVERAVEYETTRQIELLEKGQSVAQETRGWNDAAQKTTSQRSKENAHDYRYFPDPDIPPVEIDREQVATIREAIVDTLPWTLRTKLEQAGIRQEVAENLLLADAELNVGYVRTVLAIHAVHGAEPATFAAHFLVNRDMKLRREGGNTVQDGVPSATHFADVYGLLKANKLSSNNADTLLFALKNSPDATAQTVAEQHHLLQESDAGVLDAIIAEVLADPASQKAVADVKAGEQKAIGFLVGQVMKRSGGKVNPALVNQALRRHLS